VQVLYVHPNFPAQFGPVAKRLATEPGNDVVFVSRAAEGLHDGIRCLKYDLKGGATRATHYCSRTFENAVWHAHAVYEACRAAKDLKPDLIVGHSGFGTTAFLPDLYDAPLVNHFEYYYRGRDSDMDFRPEFPPRPIDHLRARTRNAMILTDLVQCTVGYAPTAWQRDVFPEPFRSRLEVAHDGVDTEFWSRREVPRRVGDETLPAGTRVVTYVSRGLEAMRGFDVFVRVAKRILEQEPETLFLVVGSEQTHYGGETRHIAAKSFRDHVLDMELPDLRQFCFLGTVPPERLVELLSISDLHIYLTVPFVLSWSLLNAMACACPVVASDTAPVREAVTHGETGLLAPFHDEEALAGEAVRLLRDRETAASLGAAARRSIEARFGLEQCAGRMRELYARALERDGVA
jgi:glycosyltransferase involved in cell wall biosynthesis